MSHKRVNVAIVGLGFGSEFIPIYQAHPDAEMYAICRRNKAELEACGAKFGIPKERRYTDFEAMLKDPNIDAVHINSPIPDHGPQTIAALKAGKHVACTVPMATKKEEIQEIIELQRKTGKVYMMMETVVYAREYLFAKDLYDRGVLGRIQFLRGSHQQDMDGWPGYWPGLPPMWYATHCVSPCLAILSDPAKGKLALAESVVCHGSGRIREEFIPIYGSPFAIETATFKIKDSDVCAEVTRSLYDTARQYRESFDVTASNASFEWQQLEGEDPVLHMRGLPEHQIPRRVKVPDFAGRLPDPIRKFTGAIHDATHLSFVQGGGHGGSHPHLAHNFLMAVLGNQPAFPDAPTSANWTLVGICAHESALSGDRVKIPMW
ncbi:oxidoreductase : Oxidoreductase domain protein OS=Isosphaera pallida (strain ATCC 43644 / DSM 9630 / IS1B) GN=Isop_3612 PE=4 SV=1: GFO_IDH_MocA [Gemmata massiliana]|uniref:Gfo/Idh/MocA-like oxidoreductase N-terminal domain-containing protein n=1 Tax=Gemmata massiliana TaxID=1210884 RepID=A0A6P2D0T8_9BACT|nr:Gfo/Idh/MocA family oxidoreductase [Gemmata massiliana]VTR93032.1 oxidoreductase : Oxidoreductase domain protein OS=Isosphaera pallida (strain ATCC 43644 / DSM 9630 / IS1B) GN=Isop_3612 PE=4 SV=1: GFO_IDH_MocA [Gemmata massiliana]